ncbi:hypothetical protein ARMGADRAFT_1019276 [Armillaria gallica]|uniref:Uncharacterized protein n=1 Tax=Armillaria gallica TaxID=47427 RepID=A0A2H3CJ63_ARMGA|nr:hypothetical protein ARMGADRAFT_1019276 [Armillaria gallica]
MLIHKIDRTLDSRQDGVIIHEEAETESQGIGGDEEHKQRPVKRAVESDEEGADEADETESEEEDIYSGRCP